MRQFMFIMSNNHHYLLINENNNYIIEMIEQINETRVLYFYEKLMMFGVRYTGTQNCSMAGDWIYEEFDKMG